MEVDTSGLLGAFTIIGKYAADPNVGPAIAGAMQAATQLATAEPTKVFNQSMSIIPSSQEKLAMEAKDKASLLDLANLWIPLIIVIVGLILLLLGLYLLSRARKASAGGSKA